MGHDIFPAHKYVLLSRAPDTFTKWIESAENGRDVFIDIEDLTAVAFGLILNIIYTNHFLTEDGKWPLNVWADKLNLGVKWKWFP